MNIEEAFNKVATRVLGVPGTMVECMIKSNYYGIKGRIYEVCDVIPGKRFSHLNLLGTTYAGVDPLKYRKAS